MRSHLIAQLCLVTALGCLVSGCSTTFSVGRSPSNSDSDPVIPPASLRVNFNDPLLNKRQILLFGPIDQRTAEVTIQKLLFLDGKGHEPIDLFLLTPGGDMKYAFAVEQTMRLIQSPVNTYALSECNSGGALLLAAGTGKRYAFHRAVIVIHGLAIHGQSKPPPDFVDAVQNGYTDFWRKKSKLPPSWLPLPFGSIHVLTARQALEYGIVDEVVDK